MVPSVRSEIDRQVSRVRRRLFVRELIRQGIAWSVAALALTTAWILAEPFFASGAPDWTRWAVLGGSLGFGALAATTLAILRRPNVIQSALWLDDAFSLRERVTTSLALSAEDAQSPAGQALLGDALHRVKNIRVRERFPITLGKHGWLVPSAAGVLALVALFYNPTINTAQGTSENKQLSAADKAALEKKLEALQRPKRDPLVNPERAKSEDLRKLEAKLDEIAKQPRDTAKQLRERIKDLTPLEEEVKKLERERGDRGRMMQQQLQMKDAFAPNESAKDGPANDLQQALADGDVDKAKDELTKLAKKLANDELTEKEKQQLAKQMDNLQKKLGDMSHQKKKEDLLKKLAEEGKLDPEALERELAQLKQDNEKLKDLQKLANKLNQCQNCMKAGDMAGAQKAMSDASDQLSDLAKDMSEIDDLRNQLKDLQEMRDALAKAADDIEPCPGGNCNGQGGEEGGRSMSDRPGMSDMSQNKGGVGSGRRPDGEQGKVRPFDAKQSAKFDPKGKKVFDGFVPGQAFKKKSGVDLAGDIKQAAQDAPEAIETQRIPKAARDMAKGYFKNLGGQAEGDKKPDSEKKAEEKPKE